MNEQLDLPIDGTLEPGSNQQTLTYWEQVDGLINRRIPSKIGRGKLPLELSLFPVKNYVDMVVDQLREINASEDWSKPLNWEPQEDVKFDVIPALLRHLKQYCTTGNPAHVLAAAQELLLLSIRDGLRTGKLPVFVPIAKTLQFPTE